MRSLLALMAVASVTAALTAAAGAGAASGAECGLYPQNIDGEVVYLAPITRRENVSCRRAKRVARKALRELGGEGVVLCDEPDHFRGWTIRHVGNEHALHGRFVKDEKRFDLRSQGSC